MAPLYSTQATAIGGRSGAAASADGRLRVSFSMPKELGGPGGDGTNPEQLFAIGYAACFLTSIENAAAQANIVIAKDSNVTASVGLGPQKGRSGFRLSVLLEIDLPGMEAATAEHVVRLAHARCPYSNAILGNVDVSFSIA